MGNVLLAPVAEREKKQNNVKTKKTNYNIQDSESCSEEKSYQEQEIKRRQYASEISALTHFVY